MKKTMIVCIAMILVKSSEAQNPNMDYRFSIKVNNLARYDETEKFRSANPATSYFYDDKNNHLKLIHPTVALQWKTRKNNFHEIEMTDLKWENNVSSRVLKNDSTGTNLTEFSESVTQTSIAARYEFTFVFNKKKESRLVPSVGLGLSPYYTSTRTMPKISSSFPTSEQNIGLRAFVTPRITYFIKQKLFVDFNIPICVSQTEYTKERNEDPSLPSVQREITSLDANAFPKMFSARVGIGIKL